MVCMPDSGSRGLGASPGQGHYVVSLGKKLLSQCLSPSMLGVTKRLASIPSRGEWKIHQVAS